MKSKSRVLSILLALAMILTFMPAMAFADGADGPVAKIGDQEYATLKAAVDAATTGQTIDLIKDTTVSTQASVISVEGKTLTIRGNHTITATVGDVFEADTGGKLTLGDNVKISSSYAVLYAHSGGVIDVDGADITCTNSSSNAALATGTGSQINFISGSLSMSGSGSVSLSVKNGASSTISGSDTIISNDTITAIAAKGTGATITINGGSVKTTSAYVAGYACGGGKIIVNEGNVTSNGWCALSAIKYDQSTGGTIEINGGIIEKAVGAYEGSDSELIINGGTIGDRSSWGVYVTDGASGTITDGEISGYSQVNGNNGSLSISGGVFSTDVSYYILEEADGVPVAPVATINRGEGDQAQTLYAVRTSVGKAIQNGDKVTVTKGLPLGGDGPDAFSAEGKDVEVVNKTGEDLSVEGFVIENDKQIGSKEAKACGEAVQKADAAEEAKEALEEAKKTGDEKKIAEAAQAYQEAATAADDAAKAASAAYPNSEYTEAISEKASEQKKDADKESADVADKAAAAAAKEKIDKLPAADKVAVTDKAAIEEARKAYDALTDAQKALVDAAALKKLTDAETALKAAEAAEAAKALADAKKDAAAELDKIDLSKYKDPEKSAVKKAIADAKAAIEKAATPDEVKAALAAATSEIGKQGIYNAKLPKLTNKKPAAAKKAVTVKWKKLSSKNRGKVSGIEIQIAQDKKFSKKAKIVKVKKTKASKKITKLVAKKNYWVRVRTYKTKNGVKYVGKWSKVKKIKTK